MVRCKYCGKMFKRQGIGPHMATCKKHLSRLKPAPIREPAKIEKEIEEVHDELDGIFDYVWSTLSFAEKAKVIRAFLVSKDIPVEG